jgi:hypothetical protein
MTAISRYSTWDTTKLTVNMKQATINHVVKPSACADTITTKPKKKGASLSTQRRHADGIAV